MAGLSNNKETGVLGVLLGNAALDTVTGNYIALCSQDPGDTAAGAVTAAIPVTRQSVTVGSGWTIGTDGSNPDYTSAVNTQDIVYNMAAAGGPGTVTHFAVWSTVSGTTEAEYICSGTVTPNKAFTTSDQLKFSAGNLKVRIN